MFIYYYTFLVNLLTLISTVKNFNYIRNFSCFCPATFYTSSLRTEKLAQREEGLSLWEKRKKCLCSPVKWVLTTAELLPLAKDNGIAIVKKTKKMNNLMDKKDFMSNKKN
jgi:hypothetical protein